jgi:flagellar FliL protein
MAAPVRPQKAVAKQAPPKEPAPAPTPPKEDKGRRGVLLPAIVVGVALLGAAFLLRPSGGGGDTPPAATAETTIPTKGGAAAALGDPAHVVPLEAVTLNLSDGRFLKLAIALQLEEGVEVTDPKAYGSRALDIALEEMGEYTYRELSVSGARDTAKDELSVIVSEAYEGEVLGVYFTEFVMQ